MLTFGRCAVSFAQSNCLTDEEIKKVRLVILENQKLDSTLTIARWRSQKLKDVIKGQSDLIQSYQDQIMLQEQKERMLKSQIDYARKEALRHKRRKQIFQIGTGAAVAAVAALIILK